MGWLRLVGCLKLWVCFAKEPYKREYTLQKKLIILRSLLIVATSNPLFVCKCITKSICVPVCLSVCTAICLSVCRSVCLSICLSVCQSMCLSVCLSVCLSACLFACLFVCLIVRLPVQLSVRLVCLSVCLSVCRQCVGEIISLTTSAHLYPHWIAFLLSVFHRCHLHDRRPQIRGKTRCSAQTFLSFLFLLIRWHTNPLQNTATHCNTLQHTETHCKSFV